jgi:TatD DNase family protein
LEFIDTHTHFYLEHFDKDREQAFNTARSLNVKKMLMPNVDVSTIEAMLEVASQFAGDCLPMMALHPTSVKEDYQQQLQIITEYLRQGGYCAIGETGLDMYWDTTFIEQQQTSFRKHIELSLELDLPLVIHSRNSLQEIFDVMDEYKGSDLKGVFHCFPGDIQQAEKVLKMGFMLGIGGVVTYKNSMMARVVEHTGIEHLLLETDSPYLPPVPHRGKRNESSFLPLIAQKIAELKQLPLQTVANTTTENAKRLFRIS